MTQAAKEPSSNGHTWRFVRAGGFDQVRLDSVADLRMLDRLDQKLWMALSCPTRGLEFDDKTLDIIDTDHDGRIRAPEVIAATQWALSMLKRPDELLKPSPSLPLDAINDATPEGQQLLDSARQILENLGKKGAAQISLDDTTDTARIFAQTQFNGDGIIPAEAADDLAVHAVIQDIIVCLGAQTDRSGKPGIDQTAVDRFFTEAQDFSDWWAKAENEASVVLPLGACTAGAAEALQAVRSKIDDYFTRCRLASFDPRSLPALNRQESDYVAIAAGELSLSAQEVANFPIARVEAGRPLPLKEGVNPAWSAAVAAFDAQLVKPLLGERAALSEAEWATVNGRLAPYQAWLAGKPATAVEPLGLPRIRATLAGPGRQVINDLIVRDKALEPHANAIAAVDKLIRLNAELYKLLNNFVSFRDFYGRKQKAVFQAGTLYLDQRSCDLCVRVEDIGKHAATAYLSQTYLAYCALSRRNAQERMTIAAAITGGDSDNLMVGRNAIFYDRQGRDWDATIVKIIDNPIGIAQAFWTPYKRGSRWIGEQIAKRAGTAAAGARDKFVTAAISPGKPQPDPNKPPELKPKLDVGVVAALGVAVGGLTAALGMMCQVFFGLGMWMPLGLIALVLLISCPSMIIAWFKLRQRNLGPILNANGWAVNARAKINIPFGRSLTSTAKLPAGARRDFRDPYAESKAGRNNLCAAIALVVVGWGLWYFGAIERVTPGLLPKSGWVIRREAADQKASVKPAPAVAATSSSAPASQPGK